MSRQVHKYLNQLLATGPFVQRHPSASSADLVDNLLGIANPAKKSGYSFTYSPVAATPGTQYTILAVPSSSSTGQQHFFTDQSGVIRQTTDGTTPTVTSGPIG
jgi:hypothetical protein